MRSANRGYFFKLITVLLLRCLFILVIGCPTQTVLAQDRPTHFDAFAGQAVDENEQPLKAAKVFFRLPTSDERQMGTTDDKGMFKFTNSVEVNKLVYAMIRIESLDGTKVGFCQRLESIRPKSILALKIKVTPKKVAQVRVVDSAGQPIANASVFADIDVPNFLGPVATDADGLAKLELSSESKVRQIIAVKEGKALAFWSYEDQRMLNHPSHKPRTFNYDSVEELQLGEATPLRVHVVDDNNQPLSDVNLQILNLANWKERQFLISYPICEVLAVKTDSNGDALVEWFPKWHTTRIELVARREGYCEKFVYSYSELPSPKIDFKLERECVLRGNVVGPKGNPVSNAQVLIQSDKGQSYPPTRTDEDGSYEVRVAPNCTYKVSVNHEKLRALDAGIPVLPTQDSTECNLQLCEPTRVYGKVIDQSTGQPVSRMIMRVLYKSKHQTDAEVHSMATDSQGLYEVILTDGEYYISVPSMSDKHPFTVKGEGELKLDISIKFPELIEFSGRVVNGDDTPAVGATVYCERQTPLPPGCRAEADKDGIFKMLRPNDQGFVSVVSANGSSRATIAVAVDDAVKDIKLEPLAAVSGRLLSSDGSMPEARVKIRVAFDGVDPKNLWSARVLLPDENGNFKQEQLQPGWQYQLQLYYYESKIPSAPIITRFKLKPGETLDLGDLRVPDVDPTF